LKLAKRKNITITKNSIHAPEQGTLENRKTSTALIPEGSNADQKNSVHHKKKLDE